MASIYDAQSQNDARWRAALFGFGGVTYGGYGCYVVSKAMVATHYLGRLVLPTEMNNALKAHNGFAPGTSLLYDDSLHRAFPQILYVTSHHFENNQNVAQILAALSDDKEVDQIIEVDFSPGGTVQTHFVRFFAKVNGRIIIDDPIDGVRRDLASKYGPIGTAVQKVVDYRFPGFWPPWVPRPVVVPPVVADPRDAQIATLQAQLAVANGWKTALDQANGGIDAAKAALLRVRP